MFHRRISSGFSYVLGMNEFRFLDKLHAGLGYLIKTV